MQAGAHLLLQRLQLVYAEAYLKPLKLILQFRKIWKEVSLYNSFDPICPLIFFQQRLLTLPLLATTPCWRRHVTDNASRHLAKGSYALRSATGVFSPESQACLKAVSNLLFTHAAKSQSISALSLNTWLKCKPYSLLTSVLRQVLTASRIVM